MPKRKPTDPNTPVKPNRTQAYLDRLTKRLSRDITIYTKEAMPAGLRRAAQDIWPGSFRCQ